MSCFALGRLKNHKVPHLHPNSTMFMPLDRLQLKIYAFSGKFNVCSKRVLLSWIKICRDFTLQTQIFTQKYRSWLRFYSEFLRKKLAAEGSETLTCLFTICGKLKEKLFQIWYSNQFHYISICFRSPRSFQFTLRIFPTVKEQFSPQNIPLITCIWIGFFITSFILFISEYSQY